MDIYKFVGQENGDILLEKITIKESEYNIIKKENGNVLLKKKINHKIDKLDDMKKYNFRNSKILSCKIDDENIEKLKYNSIRVKIYEKIGNGNKIIKSSIFNNIQTIRKDDEGFTYIEDLGISIQGVDSNKCLLEIITQCINYKISIEIRITLEDESNIFIIF